MTGDRPPWLALPYVVGALALPVVLVVDDIRVSGPAYFAAQLTTLVTCLSAARLAAGTRAARAWLLLTAGLVVLTLSSVAYVLSGVVDDTDGFRPGDGEGWFTFGSGLRAVFAVIFLVAMLGATRPARRGAARWRLGFDLATVLGGTFMLAWYFVLGPIAIGREPALDEVSGQFVALTVSDLVILVAIGAVLLTGGEVIPRRPLRFLIAAVVAYVAADVVVVVSALSAGPVVDRGIRGALQLLPSMLIGLAAAEQARLQLRGDPEERAARPPRPAPWLPYVALVSGFGLLAVAAVRAGLYPWGGLVVGGMLMTFSVAVRQFTVLTENRSMATKDVLTGLANRIRLQEVLDEVEARSARGGAAPTAVMVIDLDDFKPVNDTLGHDAGDALLVRFAQVLHATVRRSDTAARLGGDEFAVVLHDVDDPQVAVRVAERILAGIAEPVDIVGRAVRIRASIGIAVSAPDRPVNPDELVREADLAMYEAKRDRTSGWQLFLPGTADGRAEQARLRDELRSAVGAGQMRAVYQPVVSLADGQVVGFEALVRWQHPTRGLLSPAVFLPLAEKAGLVHDIDFWVLGEACAQVREWQRRLPSGRTLQLNANLSEGQLARPNLAALVVDVLARTGFDPHDLVLEVSETSELVVEQALAHCVDLRGRGVRLALDDFGTGHSPLEHLLRMPVDVLKLDGCFVTEVAIEPASMAIAQAVVRLGQVLSLETVAEGIETEAQATQMRELGYAKAQGYHFARPLTPEEVPAALGLTGSLESLESTGPTGSLESTESTESTESLGSTEEASRPATPAAPGSQPR